MNKKIIYKKLFENKKYLYILILIILILSIVFIYNKKYQEDFTIKKIENHSQNIYLDQELPKNIFIYWHEKDIQNEFVKKNIKYLRDILSNDYTIHLYNEESIKNELTEDELKYMNQSKEHFADYIRLILLKKYGGFWLDCSILITNKSFLDNICETYKKNKFDVFLFEYSWRNASDKVYDKYLENWFISSPKNSIFISDMLDEYKKALDMTFIKYKQLLKNENIDLQGTIEAEDDVYLMQHAIIRKLLKRNKYNIYYDYAQDSMFKINDKCGWENNCIFDNITNLKNNNEIYGIKLTGAQRNHFVEHRKDDLNNMFETLYRFQQK
jgi:hypothetical protein